MYVTDFGSGSPQEGSVCGRFVYIMIDGPADHHDSSGVRVVMCTGLHVGTQISELWRLAYTLTGDTNKVVRNMVYRDFRIEPSPVPSGQAKIQERRRRPSEATDHGQE
jgi:hypothetical protein